MEEYQIEEMKHEIPDLGWYRVSRSPLRRSCIETRTRGDAFQSGKAQSGPVS